jgi:hypothetical protein
MGDAALRFEPMIGFRPKLGDGVCSKELRIVTRLAVASQTTALAPFSQNSKLDVCLGSGQAQPGQSNPSGWLVLSSVAAPSAIRCSLRSDLATERSDPQPPAGAS